MLSSSLTKITAVYSENSFIRSGTTPAFAYTSTDQDQSAQLVSLGPSGHLLYCVTLTATTTSRQIRGDVEELG